MRKLAIILSHPVQYYSPWFKYLASKTALKVYYFLPQDTNKGSANDFGLDRIDWGIDLFDGYESECVMSESVAYSNVDKFLGCRYSGFRNKFQQDGITDVVLMGWYLMGFWQALKVCWDLELPVYVRGDSRLTDSRGLKSLLKSLVYKRALGSFSGFLSVGVANRKYVKSFGIKDDIIFDSPHFVDHSLFNNRVGFSDLKERKSILYIGKFIDVKAPLDFLKLAQKSQKDNLDLEFKLIGDGVLKNDLKLFKNDLNLRNVHFLGFKNQLEIAEILKEARVLVLPSKSETWGLVVNEALSSYVPVLVSDGVGCGPDLVLNRGTGFIYKRHDIEAMHECLLKILSEDFNIENFDLINERFSMENTSRLLIQQLLS